MAQIPQEVLLSLFIYGLIVRFVRQRGSDNEGRILNIVLDLDGHILNIVNIYAPQTDSDRQSFFCSLDKYISEDDDNIIGGDFNCITNVRLDKIGGN